MKELFREKDFTRVAYYQSLLEAEGIPTMIRNQHLAMSGLTEIPIPEFFPALCVMREEDYERAMEIIRTAFVENAKGVDEEKVCKACGETCPGNFDVCWSCGSELTEEP